MIRMRCHCQMVVQHIECHKWTSADTKEQNRIKACYGQCPKLVSLINFLQLYPCKFCKVIPYFCTDFFMRSLPQEFLLEYLWKV